ncbi:PREDICTED: HMG-Y-related protein B-like [Nicotiana attenuata]|uniref:HMG-Y-related protein A n=1 Tax=Nicotiana attenuata TaxID=49451 RepID=A0A314LC60_NICAT|nr:PREDICTED: HMG-Y-related protein B-like [Nicotiana attenuata]OIT39093.1 hmg-y-related protein a [Nicotiana attenuata]
MATEQQIDNPTPTQLQPSAPSFLPSYPDMIMEAIEALNDENGSNKSAIAKQIDATYGTLPPAHGTLLAHHLNKMKQSGQLVMVKNNYMKPDANAPPRRGRGRPPKPKTPLPEGYVPPPPRPRGRPPKERDPHAPISVPMKITSPSSGGTGKKRGRPRKYPNDTSSPSQAVAPPPSGTPRGRGRPPKVKTPVAAEVGA